MPLTSDRDRSEELQNGDEYRNTKLWKGIFWALVFVSIPTLTCVVLYVLLKH